jgi:hypothetical protein
MVKCIEACLSPKAMLVSSQLNAWGPPYSFWTRFTWTFNFGSAGSSAYEKNGHNQSSAMHEVQSIIRCMNRNILLMLTNNGYFTILPQHFYLFTKQLGIRNLIICNL